MIAESPALLAREEQIYARYTDSLARLIAEETGAEDGAIAPWVAANALMGIHRALVDYTRRRIVAGARSPQLARDVRAQAERALALLEEGLGDLAGRPS
jgi:MftR C-terminal domain